MSGEWDDGDGGELGAALRAFYARERAAVARLAAAVTRVGVAGFAESAEPEAAAMRAAWVASAGAWGEAGAAGETGAGSANTAGAADGTGAGSANTAGAADETDAGSASATGAAAAAGAADETAAGSRGAAGRAGAGAAGEPDAAVEAGAPVVAASAPASRRWRWAAALVAAAVLAGLGWLWLRGGGAREGELRVKGPPVARLVVVASRGEGELFAVEDDARLMAGDRLGFFVTADAPGAVAVWLVDAAGATRLAPTGGRAGAFAAGARVALPEGARLTAGSGCEWLVAAFGAEPLPLGRLDGALRAPGGDGCGAPGLDAVPGVRWQRLRVRR